MLDNPKQIHETHKHNGLLLLTAMLCILSVAVMTYTLTRPRVEFVPPPFEDAAVDGTPQDVPEALGYGTLDATAYRLALCGAPEVQDGAARLYLTNPRENGVWLKVRVCAADGTLLGESGLLRTGQYLETVPLDPVPAASGPVTLKVMAYEPGTYQSAGAVTLNVTLRVP